MQKLKSARVQLITMCGVDGGGITERVQSSLDNLTEIVVLTNRHKQNEMGEWVDTDSFRFVLSRSRPSARWPAGSCPSAT